MNQIVMPPKTAASASRSIVESRNAPNLPELPLILASCPSSMSVNTKTVAVNAPGKSSPIGNMRQRRRGYADGAGDRDHVRGDRRARETLDDRVEQAREEGTKEVQHGRKGS